MWKLLFLRCACAELFLARGIWSLIRRTTRYHVANIRWKNFPQYREEIYVYQYRIDYEHGLARFMREICVHSEQKYQNSCNSYEGYLEQASADLLHNRDRVGAEFFLALQSIVGVKVPLSQMPGILYPAAQRSLYFNGDSFSLCSDAMESLLEVYRTDDARTQYQALTQLVGQTMAECWMKAKELGALNWER